MDLGHRKENVAVDKRVREAGLRPTRQRIALADLLFAKGDRHLSAEECETWRLIHDAARSMSDSAHWAMR